ncbi:MAG TPA: ABC-2 family transporter protein [Minicystis sp.]|nr:ABC-2 family transporter protein [Minicystis sp.]
MRYLTLLGVELRLSMATSMQYRWNFFVDGAVSFVWTALGLVPLVIAFQARPTMSGWTFDDALVVVAWFTLLKGVLDGAVNPSLLQVVDHIRQGTLDFVLLKPADAQFLVSTARFELWKGLDAVASLALFAFAFHALGRLPSAGGSAIALVLLACAVLVLYSVWILVIAAAFWVVRLDNLAYLLSSLFDFARWPVSIFKGAWRIVFTFVVPLAVLTTYPAEALLGRLSTRTALVSIAGSVAFAFVARRVWLLALGRYTSASS